LIQVKVDGYEKHVLANKQAFLSFFVQGAVAYYENNEHISHAEDSHPRGF
jgi:hypothetical protein